MVNHPNRTKKPEAWLRAIIRLYKLDHVAITTSDGVAIFARAYPNKWHPIVEQRRTAEFERLTAEGIAISVDRAAQVQNEARDLAIGVGRASTLADAIEALHKDLIAQFPTDAEAARTKRAAPVK